MPVHPNLFASSGNFVVGLQRTVEAIGSEGGIQQLLAAEQEAQ